MRNEQRPDICCSVRWIHDEHESSRTKTHGDQNQNPKKRNQARQEKPISINRNFQNFKRAKFKKILGASAYKGRNQNYKNGYCLVFHFYFFATNIPMEYGTVSIESNSNEVKPASLSHGSSSWG